MSATATALRPMRHGMGSAEFTIGGLCDLLGYQLSDEQIAAVTADLGKPLRIIAGAGSGKTSVMAARVVWAVGQGRLRPEQVVGLTFTTKAAAELAARIRLLLGRLVDRFELPELGDDPLAGEPLITTYHSFAHQLVAEHGLRIGVEPGFRLLAANESAELAYDVLCNTRHNLPDFRTSPAQLVGAVVSLDQQMAEHAVDPAQLREHCQHVIGEIDGLAKTVAADREMKDAALRRLALAAIVAELRQAKLDADVADFGDLLRFGHRLSGLDAVADQARERWPLVLLDEYQDTSVVQARILSSIFGRGHPVTAVGDPMQAIYGWRGASVAAMDDFPSAFESSPDEPVRTCELSVSHRCGPRILRAANALAEPLRNSAEVVTLRPATLDLANPRPDSVRVALLRDYKTEVQWVADRVAEQVRIGVPPGEIAVLCRATSDFEPLASALAAKSILAQVSTVEGVLAQPEVVDVLSILEVVNDPAANAAMLRILLGPRWRIGPRDLAVLGRRAADLARSGHRNDVSNDLDNRLAEAVTGTDSAELASLLEAVRDPGDRADYPLSAAAEARLKLLGAELAQLALLTSAPLPDLVDRVIAVTGLDVEVSLNALRQNDSAGGADRGVAALHAIRRLAAGSSANGTGSLGGFLAWVSSARRFDASPALEIAPQAGAVQLLTVHKAKGLEWQVVVVPFLCEQVFPSARGRSKWTSTHSELPHRLRGDREMLPDLAGYGTRAHQTFADQMRTYSDGEERRLAYVAATRASRTLIASGHWWGPTQKRKRGPSPYLLALRDCAVFALRDGAVDAEWEPEPIEDANPTLAGERFFQWPPVADAGLADRRRAAASMVNRYLNQGAPEGAGDERTEGDSSPEEAATIGRWDHDLLLLQREGEFRALPGSGLSNVIAAPSSLSASELIAWHRNPEAFALRRSRPLPQEPSLSARRGTKFHSWVEQRFGQRQLFEEIPDSTDDEYFADEELAQLQAGFLGTPYADIAPHGVEVPFAIVIGGRVIRGRIDAIYKRSGRWQVVDWKTSRARDSDPLQLSIYRIAWARMQRIEMDQVDAAFVYVRTGEVVELAELASVADLESVMAG